MRAIHFQKLGGPDVLELTEQHPQSPGPGEVRIRVTSAGLNRADLLFIQGKYYQKANVPSRVGCEAAGVVEEAGEGVTFRAGDRVGVLPSSFDIRTQGGLAESVTVPASCLVPTPASIDDRDAGAIWMQYLTVWGALRGQVQTKPGDFVVITAASSSVGLSAIEYARFLGATPIATTTSADKVSRLKEHGATHVIDRKNEDYGSRIKKITNGRGVQTVFDAVAGPAMSDHVRACAPGGVIVLYGLLDTRPMECFPGLMIGKNVRIQGYSIRSLEQDSVALKQAVREVGEAVESGKLRPVVDRRFPLSETRQAFEYLASNRQFGKIVVNP